MQMWQSYLHLKENRWISILAIIVILSIAVAIRFLYYFHLPSFITLDSINYILLSQMIYDRLDFSHPHLGGIRTPIYPIFLAISHFFTDFSSSDIVLLHKFLSIITIFVGIVIGYLLRSFLLSVTLSLFISLNPVYLFNDHLIMTEGLFLLILLAFLTLSLLCLESRSNILVWLGLGFLFGVCILTRSNGLFFCLPILLGLLLNKRAIYNSSDLSQKNFPILKWLTAFSIGGLFVVAPWLWRNYTVFGTISLTNYTQRNLLVYQSVHNIIDTELPKFSEANSAGFYNPQTPQTIYDLIKSLGEEGVETIKAEEKAGLLVREQLMNHPMRYIQAVTYAILNFSGYPTPNPPHYGRTDVEWWFWMIRNIDSLHANNLSGEWYEYTDFYYVKHGEDNMLTLLFSQAGQVYLRVVRKILFDVFLLIFFFYLVKGKIDIREKMDWAIVFLGLTYLFVLMLHFATLSDYDRYTSPFDWMPITVISLVISKFLISKGKAYHQVSSF